MRATTIPPNMRAGSKTAKNRLNTNDTDAVVPRYQNNTYKISIMQGQVSTINILANKNAQVYSYDLIP